MEELRADQGTFTLRLGTSLLRSAHTWMLLLGMVGLPLILIVLVVSLSEGLPDGRELWTEIWAEFVEDPGNRAKLWTAVVLLPVGIAVMVLQSRARLGVTTVGLEAYFPRWLGIALFRQTVGQWAIRWDEVRRVRLVVPSKPGNATQRLGASRLVIETPQLEARVAVFSWFEGGGRDHRLGLGELIAFRKLDVVQRLQDTPLIRAVEARGLEIEIDVEEGGPASRGFDLTQHKGLQAQIALLFGAGLYALVDTFFTAGYLPLGPLPVSPFAAAGVGATIAVWKLGRGAPAVERVSVGVLAVTACIAAAYPATLRLNASTAEAEMVTYVSAGSGRFEAPEGRLPPIDLSGEDVPEYWSLYPPGAEHEFTLLRGVAGIYQVAMAPFYERTRELYRESRGGS